MRISKRLFLGAAVLALFCFGQTSQAHALRFKSGDSHGSLFVNGTRRSFRFHIPKSCKPSEKLPLIIVLHGALGSSWSAAWDSRMTAQSEKHHFIVAYPNGSWRTWNAGLCCGPARSLRIDDVAFIRAMIERFESEIPIDKNRIFATGISNGGMMAYRLGLELSEKLAAVVSIEGCMFDSGTSPEFPISVLAIHGTKDKIIRYEGGTGSMFGYKVKSQSVADTVNFWVFHDKCEHLPFHEDTGSVSKDLYAGGADGTEVCLYTLKGAGHAWPGGRRCVFLGDHPSKKFSATDAICSFCLSHPKINLYTSADD